MTSVPSNGFVFKYRFALVFLTAAILLQIPVISIPFKWFESYFHEISHGLAAIVTGGKVLRIELFPNGAGLCTTIGGSRLFTSFMGYAGAAIWGTLIYLSATVHQRMAKFVHLLVASLLICSLLFWVSDVLTFAIIGVLLTVVLLKFKFSNALYLQFSMQVLGALVLINSVFSPLYLLAYAHQGDSTTLAQLTMIPAFIWIIIWFAMGMCGIVFLAKISKQRTAQKSFTD